MDVLVGVHEAGHTTEHASAIALWEASEGVCDPNFGSPNNEFGDVVHELGLGGERVNTSGSSHDSNELSNLLIGDGGHCVVVVFIDELVLFVASRITIIIPPIIIRFLPSTTFISLLLITHLILLVVFDLRFLCFISSSSPRLRLHNQPRLRFLELTHSIRFHLPVERLARVSFAASAPVAPELDHLYLERYCPGVLLSAGQLEFFCCLDDLHKATILDSNLLCSVEDFEAVVAKCGFAVELVVDNSAYSASASNGGLFLLVLSFSLIVSISLAEFIGILSFVCGCSAIGLGHLNTFRFALACAIVYHGISSHSLSSGFPVSNGGIIIRNSGTYPSSSSLNVYSLFHCSFVSSVLHHEPIEVTIAFICLLSNCDVIGGLGGEANCGVEDVSVEVAVAVISGLVSEKCSFHFCCWVGSLLDF